MSKEVPASRITFLSFLPRDYSRSSTVINNLGKFSQIDFFQVPAGKIQAFQNIRKITAGLDKKRDRLVIMSPSHILSFYARINFRGAIILDAGWGHTDSEIVRFRKVSALPRLLRAYLIDVLSFHAASMIFLESREQIIRSKRIYFLRNKQIQLNYTGVNESAFSVTPLIPKELKLMDEKRPVILFRGSFNPESGLDLISRVWQESILSDTTLIVACRNIPGEIYFSQNTILLTRFLEYGEIRYLYELADLTLGQFGNTGRQQVSIPHKVFESGFFGKPYLSPSSNALNELFSDKEIFFEDSFNPGEIAKRIITILQNDKLRLRTQRKFASFYSQNLSSTLLAYKFMSEIENRFPEPSIPF